MLCIKDNRTDPYFNLAAEEYILKNFHEDCFMLWRNQPSVVIGKHQNALAEINLSFIEEKKIILVRRISGGGAVYHDTGNLNFTFIMNGKDGNLVNFRKFTQPVLDLLQELGVDATFEGRNNLTIIGRKFSGNAEHVWKNRILHHGTLLFSSSLNDLSSVLKTGTGFYTDKAVKSIPSGVTNIKDHLNQDMDINEFRDRIMDHIMTRIADSILYEYSPTDILSIEKLVKEKYSRWEWNYGYSPSYHFRKDIYAGGKKMVFNLNAEKGYIMDISISSDVSDRKDISLIERSLIGQKHEKEVITHILAGLKLDHFFRDITIREFVAGMF